MCCKTALRCITMYFHSRIQHNNKNTNKSPLITFRFSSRLLLLLLLLLEAYVRVSVHAPLLPPLRLRRDPQKSTSQLLPLPTLRIPNWSSLLTFCSRSTKTINFSAALTRIRVPSRWQLALSFSCTPAAAPRMNCVLHLRNFPSFFHVFSTQN